MLILHKGRVAYERYFGCLDEAGKHGAMSMTKSITGLLAEILVADGALDDATRVSPIVPEAARGVHGQTIYVDPKADMVILRFASFPTAKNAKIDPTSLPAFHAVAEYLMSK